MQSARRFAWTSSYGQPSQAVVRLLLLLAVILWTGCRSTYYAAWEQFGKHKRDLLKDSVEAVRDDQKQAAEQFKDTLTRLKELYKFEGGELEKTYNQLNSDFQRSQQKAEAVRTRIAKVEQIATDLFREWEGEIQSMQNARLATQSRKRLAETKDRFQSLRQSMNRAEGSMEPVLTQLRDQVLYLKHHLNAQALGALRDEATTIEREIQTLIKEMNASIAEANRFIQTLE